ncbi:MAG: hypothetical protein WC637_00150 [Victivallales bacterium]|jgi:hypothetical protein
MIQFDAEKHEYRCNGVLYPSVTQILADMGLIDTSWFTEYSRERGTLVHRIIQWHLAGDLDEESIDPALRPYFDAFIRFQEESKFVAEEVEKPFASVTCRFAGTPDLIGCLNGHNAIVDIKTGAPQPWTALQLAGYEILVKHPSMERFSLQLTDEGKYKLTHHKDRQDRGVFLAALAVYYWKKNNTKG